jgi:hypothetical protein
MTRPVGFGVAALVLIAGIGCATRGPGPLPADPLPDDRCAELHADRIARRQGIGGLAGSGRLRLRSGSKKGRAAFDFTFRRPETLRLEFRTPLGPVAAVLDIEGDRWLFADFREGHFVHGDGDATFRRFTGLPAGPTMLLAVMLAEIRPGDRGLRDVRFHPGTCRLLGCRFASVTVSYRWPAAETDVAPEAVVFRGPGADRETVIRFSGVRPLSKTELNAGRVPVDTTGLREADPAAGNEGVPQWLQ